MNDGRKYCDQRGVQKIAGMGWTGPFSAAPAIPSLWREFAERVHEIEYRIHPRQFIAASHDRPTDFTSYIGVRCLIGVSCPM